MQPKKTSNPLQPDMLFLIFAGLNFFLPRTLENLSGIFLIPFLGPALVFLVFLAQGILLAPALWLSDSLMVVFKPWAQDPSPPGEFKKYFMKFLFVIVLLYTLAAWFILSPLGFSGFAFILAGWFLGLTLGLELENEAWLPKGLLWERLPWVFWGLLLAYGLYFLEGAFRPDFLAEGWFKVACFVGGLGVFLLLHAAWNAPEKAPPKRTRDRRKAAEVLEAKNQKAHGFFRDFWPWVSYVPLMLWQSWLISLVQQVTHPLLFTLALGVFGLVPLRLLEILGRGPLTLRTLWSLAALGLWVGSLVPQGFKT